VKSPTIPGAGREAFVVGKAFNLEVGGTSSLLIGETGVYLMKVTNKTDATPLDNYSTYAGALNVSNLNSVFFSSFNALKEAAVIEDFRALFY